MLRRISLLLMLFILAACGGEATTTPAATSGATGATTAPAATESSAATAAPTTEAATAEPTAPAATGGTVTLMTYDSFAISPEVQAAFEQQSGAKLQILKAGDTGSMLNRAILSKDAPLADVIYGIDNTFYSRAIEADIMEPYAPKGSDALSAELKLDDEHHLTPVAIGYVNINYDREAFGAGKLPVPQTLRDLTKPEYKGALVVENPATSSPGLAFLLTTIAAFGEEGDYTWKDFWAELRANEVIVANSWDDAYYTHFSGAGGGEGTIPMVVSYATSPAAEVYFAEAAPEEAPTVNFIPAEGAFRQVEYAGILKGTQNRALAEQLMDFLVSQQFQEDIPLNMFVYPALPTAEHPAVFKQFAEVPATSAELDPALISEKRDQWIQEWTTLVTR